MVENSLNQPTNKIAICAASILPLGIYFDQNDIIRFDQTRRASQIRLPGRTVKFQPLASHQMEKRIDPNVVVLILQVVKGQIGDILNPEKRAPWIGFRPPDVTERMKH
jgi:hypothetical protein